MGHTDSHRGLAAVGHGPDPVPGGAGEEEAEAVEEAGERREVLLRGGDGAGRGSALRHSGGRLSIRRHRAVSPTQNPRGAQTVEKVLTVRKGATG